MHTNPIKMIVTDLDNTLLRSDKSISGYTVEVFRRCRARGITVVFATGRPEHATRQYQKTIVPDFIIADNGATIHQSGRVLRSLLIPKATADSLVRTLRSAPKVSCITLESENCMYTNYDGPPLDRDWKTHYTDFSGGACMETSKICADCSDNAWLAEVMAAYPDLHMYANTGETWHMIMHKDATKRNGLRQLCKILECPIAGVAAFGDDYNDVAMLRHCGTGVAVGNAIDEAKAAADFVCESNDSDGVAKWLEQNLLAFPE